MKWQKMAQVCRGQCYCASVSKYDVILFIRRLLDVPVAQLSAWLGINHQDHAWLDAHVVIANSSIEHSS
jgi:hypothetical protein